MHTEFQNGLLCESGYVHICMNTALRYVRGGVSLSLSARSRYLCINGGQVPFQLGTASCGRLYCTTVCSCTSASAPHRTPMPRCAVPGGSGEVGGTLLAVPPRLAAAQDQARPKLRLPRPAVRFIHPQEPGSKANSPGENRGSRLL